MKVSASVIIALFCASLIINPIVLLILFSHATDEAITGMVSGWDTTALNALDVLSYTRAAAMLELLDMAAVGIGGQCVSEIALHEGGGSSSIPQSNESCLSTTLEWYGSMVDNSLAALASSDVPLGSVKLVAARRLLPATSGGGGNTSNDLFQAVAIPTSAYYLPAEDGLQPSPCYTHSSGVDTSCRLLDRDAVIGSTFLLRNITFTSSSGSSSSNASLLVLGNSAATWCDDAVAVASDLLTISQASASQNNISGPMPTDTAGVVSRALAGSLLSLSVWAVAPLSATHVIMLVASRPTSTFANLTCPGLAPVIKTSNITSLAPPNTVSFETTTPSSVLGLVSVVISPTCGSCQNVPNAGGNTGGSFSQQEWMIQMILGVSGLGGAQHASPITLVLPVPFMVALVANTMLSSSEDESVLSPTAIQQSVLLACAPVGAFNVPQPSMCASYFSTGNVSPLMQRTYAAALGTFHPPQDAAALLERNGSTSQPVRSPLEFVFVEDTGADLFLTHRWLFQRQQLPCTSAASVHVAPSTTQLSILLAVPSGSSRDLMSSANTNSVIVSVSVTALAFIATLGAMHYVFHPLKSVGNLLRACADIELNGLESQTPSFMKEIFVLQQSVERLLKRFRIIGRYMPDKTQLHTVLSQTTDLQSFGDTSASIASGGRSHHSSEHHHASHGRIRGPSSGFVGGGIAHSVSVRLEYRSRRAEAQKSSLFEKLRKMFRKSNTEEQGHRGEAARDVYNRKRCAFEFVYSAHGDMFVAFMQQARERLGERVGEDLKLFTYPSSYSPSARTAGAPQLPPTTTACCTPITCDEELVDAIECCKNRTLHLVVIKSSMKNFKAWMVAAFSIVDVALLFNAAVYLLSYTSPDVRTETTVVIERAAIAMAVVVALRLVVNVVFALYLVRTLAAIYQPFSMWISDAFQEVLVVVLICSASLENMHLLFSRTRLTSALRFNAPYAGTLFRSRLFRWCLWSLVMSDIIPLGLCVFAVSQLRVLDAETFLGMLSSSLIIVLFAVEHYLDKLILRYKVWASGQDGFGGAHRGSEGTDAMMLLKEPPASANHAEAVEDDDDDSAPVTSSSKQRQVVEAPVTTSLYLGLSKRSASVLRIALHDAAAHYDNMDALEIQQLCAVYLGAIFSETKSHGGIVLAVSNAEVTIGFNCHQAHANHFTRCIGCYFSIEHAIRKNLVRWGVDDPDRPKVMGAVITGSQMVIGFAGSGDARSFQLLGKMHRELDNVWRVGSWYSAALTCNDEASREIAVQCGPSRETSSWWKNSFATTTTAHTGAADRMTVDSSGTGNFALTTRLIEVITDPVDPCMEVVPSSVDGQDVSTDSPAKKKTLRFADLHHQQPRKRSKLETTCVHEVLWEEGCEDMANSSKACLAFLERHVHNKVVSSNAGRCEVTAPSSGGMVDSASDPVPLPELIRSHLVLYPQDVVVHGVLRRVLSSSSAPRRRSAIGLDETLSELTSLPPGDEVDDDGTAAAEKSATDTKTQAAGKPSTIFQKICASEKYKLYFTDL